MLSHHVELNNVRGTENFNFPQKQQCDEMEMNISQN